MHARQLSHRRILHEDVERLGLVDVRTPVCAHFNQGLLRNLPDRPVDCLQIVGNAVQLLDGPPISDNFRLDFWRPLSERHQLADQVLVDHDKLSGQGSTQVDVRGIGLERLVVPHDLSSARGRHRGDQQRVAKSMSLDVVPDFIPKFIGLHPPHIRLKNTLGSR